MSKQLTASTIKYMTKYNTPRHIYFKISNLKNTPQRRKNFSPLSPKNCKREEASSNWLNRGDAKYCTNITCEDKTFQT